MNVGFRTGITASENLVTFADLGDSLAVNDPENVVPPGQIPAADIQLFPNPGNGHFDLRSVGKPFAQVSVYDIRGKLLYDFKPRKTAWHMDLSALSEGMYLVKMEIAGRVYAQRAIIRK